MLIIYFAMYIIKNLIGGIFIKEKIKRKMERKVNYRKVCIN